MKSEIDTHFVWVLHSPYPNTTWRGLEKCCSSGYSQSAVLFESEQAALNFVVAEDLQGNYYIPVRCELITPVVGASLKLAKEAPHGLKRPVNFHFTPQIEFLLTQEEYEILCEVGTHHYDSTCRKVFSAPPPHSFGLDTDAAHFGYYWRLAAEGKHWEAYEAAKEKSEKYLWPEPVLVRANFRQMDTIAKILEPMNLFVLRDDEEKLKISSRLGLFFTGALRALNEEFTKANANEVDLQKVNEAGTSEP